MALKLVSRGNLKPVGIYLFWLVNNFLVSLLGIPVGTLRGLDSDGRCCWSYASSTSRHRIYKNADRPRRPGPGWTVVHQPRAHSLRFLITICWFFGGGGLRGARVDVVAPQYVFHQGLAAWYHKLPIQHANVGFDDRLLRLVQAG